MDREILKRHLAEAEEHIATGGKNIARQRDVIAQLNGHIAERERLLRELREL